MRLLNDSLDLCLDNSASVHVDLDAVADLKFAQVVGETMYRAAFPNFCKSSSDIFRSRIRSPSTSRFVI